jgi:hypothetical protein
MAVTLAASGLGAAPPPAPVTQAVRKAVLDGLRPEVERDLKQKVRFKVDLIRTSGPWAFVRGTPVRPDGRPVDYRRTRHEEARRAGAFDDWFCALLKRSGRRWKPVRVVIGATDVPYVEWPREFGAPKALFK